MTVQYRTFVDAQCFSSAQHDHPLFFACATRSTIVSHVCNIITLLSDLFHCVLSRLLRSYVHNRSLFSLCTIFCLKKERKRAENMHFGTNWAQSFLSPFLQKTSTHERSPTLVTFNNNNKKSKSSK